MSQELIKYDKAAFVAAARAAFVPSDRQPCCVCGKYRSLTQAHHIVPLAIQFDRGAVQADHRHKWLCPTHHAAVHVLIGQSQSIGDRASKACVAVINDLSGQGGDEWRLVHEIFEAYRNA